MMKTNILKWSNDLETGNENIDSQHRQLLGLVNKLAESCSKGEGTESLHDTLDFLVQYTIRHFDDEETLQLECMFPDYESHKQLHEDFKKTVAALVNRYEETGSSTSLSNDVNRIVTTWFLQHIRLEDKKIGLYIRGDKKLF